MARITFYCSVLFLFLFSCNNDYLNTEKRHQESINTFIDSCWNKKDLSLVSRIFADDFSRIVNSVHIASSSIELEANMDVYFTGFPDLNIKINNLIIKSDQAFLSWTFTGTNTGTFGEVSATGKKVKVNGFTRIIFNEDGKILHEDVYFNDLDFLQQLGYTLVPPNVE
jgi:steroid delta-isomerase-like uncharacterized protein